MRWQTPKLEYLAVGMEIGAYRSPRPGPFDAPDGDPDELKRGRPRAQAPGVARRDDARPARPAERTTGVRGTRGPQRVDADA